MSTAERIEWSECDNPEWLMVASDGDEHWELRANDGGFRVSWGALDVTCEARDLAQAMSEAVYLLRALRQWNRQASERDRKRSINRLLDAAQEQP